MSVLLRPAGGIKNISKVLVLEQNARTKDVFLLASHDVLRSDSLLREVNVFSFYILDLISDDS